jgi:hypothetical protein
LLADVGAPRDTRLVTDVDPGASELNRELTTLLCQAGEAAGFVAVTEHPVRGGRLDVVWTWLPEVPMSGLDTPVPVVGFEVESSWRTRKHVKGDLLNLQDAGVALGVIVLAGTDPKDDGLRRFAELLVDRPGPNILIWTAEDVRALATGDRVAAIVPAGVSTRETDGVLDDVNAVAPMPSAPPTSVKSRRPATSHAGKYAPLYRWLRGQDGGALSASFRDIEEVLGFPLPNSSRTHVAHWHGYEGSAVARAIADAGWKASRVNLETETLTLIRSHD